MNRKRTIIILSVLFTAAILALIAVTTLYLVDKKANDTENERLNNELENQYERQYYELVDNVNSMQVAMSKLMASNSDTTQKSLLEDTAKYADASAICLSGLAVKDGTSATTMKYINQLGDYCCYLNDKITRGEELSDEDINNLKELYAVMKEVSKELGNTYQDLAKNGGSILDSMQEGGIFYSSVNILENQTVTYPSLIYDGPFSDALETQTPKALNGKTISQEEGISKASTILSGLEIQNVSYIGSGSKNFESMQFVADTNIGKAYYELSAVGGLPISMNIPYSVKSPAYETDRCQEVASQYLEQLGFTDMQPVWVSNYNCIAFINFAYVKNNVICYSDLVKVKVATDNLNIVGLEGLSYVYNHTERTIPTPTISEDDAANGIHENIEIESVRLALIPRDGSKELLCYEVYGMDKDGQKYFIYVDAQTGNEANIMVVIDSEYGEALS